MWKSKNIKWVKSSVLDGPRATQVLFTLNIFTYLSSVFSSHPRISALMCSSTEQISPQDWIQSSLCFWLDGKTSRWVKRWVHNQVNNNTTLTQWHLNGLLSIWVSPWLPCLQESPESLRTTLFWPNLALHLNLHYAKVCYMEHVC